MAPLPSSPRRRRRLARVAATVAAAAVAATAVALLPEGTPPPPSAPLGPPVPEAFAIAEEREVPVSPADRRAITRTLDRFVHAAVERRDLPLAWELAGPGLRAGTTRADWLRGDLPVFPFPAAAETFGYWEPELSYADRVSFDLMLHAERQSGRGAISVTVDVIRRGDRWLVDTWFPAAIFSDPDERPWVIGVVDFTPTYDQSDYFETPKFAVSKLGPAWILVPLAVFGAVLAMPVVVLLLHVRRNRRALARYRASQPAATD